MGNNERQSACTSEAELGTLHISKMLHIILCPSGAHLRFAFVKYVKQVAHGILKDR